MWVSQRNFFFQLCDLFPPGATLVDLWAHPPDPFFPSSVAVGSGHGAQGAQGGAAIALAMDVGIRGGAGEEIDVAGRETVDQVKNVFST
jgi:hypothetical protein